MSVAPAIAAGSQTTPLPQSPVSSCTLPMPSGGGTPATKLPKCCDGTAQISSAMPGPSKPGSPGGRGAGCGGRWGAGRGGGSGGGGGGVGGREEGGAGGGGAGRREPRAALGELCVQR